MCQGLLPSIRIVLHRTTMRHCGCRKCRTAEVPSLGRRREGRRSKPLALPPTTGHGKGDQEKHDSNDTDDVRHHGYPTGEIARVRPDEADNRSHDEQSNHRG